MPALPSAQKLTNAGRASACLAAAALLLGVWVSTTGTACDARVVDVGANAAVVGPAEPSVIDAGIVRSQYGCAEWIDEELYALREGSCGGSCSSSPDGPYRLESKQVVIAATAGQWLFCEGTLGPSEAIGVEFAPGCRLYFLRKDRNGVTVRGTEAEFQARYDIHDPRPAGWPRRIDVHLDEEKTITFDVAAFRCPERLELVSPDLRLELAPGFVDAGRPDPTR